MGYLYLCLQYDGTFADHLEMFIQLGYVVLFSSAFPLAALCALINNLVEMRSDAFKLCFIFQRPFGQRVPNIGTWQVRWASNTRGKKSLHIFRWMLKLTLLLPTHFTSIRIVNWYEVLGAKMLKHFQYLNFNRFKDLKFRLLMKRINFCFWGVSWCYSIIKAKFIWDKFFCESR